MAKRRIIKVFECWQSEDKTTRNFIRKALKKVEEIINKDENLEYAVEIDRDTQNIVGSVDIQKVILNKIDKCDIFICDISNIGNNSNTGDPIINNNVAFELGYVCGSKKVTGNILLANSDTTESKDLPFDIRNLRVNFFSIENDKSAEKLSKSIMDIISQYVNEVSGVIYKEEEDTLLKAIQEKNAPRSKADSVIRNLYQGYIDLYPKTFNAETYMVDVYDALIKTSAITSRVVQIIEAAVDYGQTDVLESIYNNLETILVECSPNPNGYSDAQLEYSDIVCSDIILIMLGVLIDRRKWGLIKEIKESFMPIHYFNKNRTISMSDFSELRSPRNIMEYMKKKNDTNYYFPISILEKEMHPDDIQSLKYICSGDLFTYLSDRGNGWYFPQTTGLLSERTSDMTPKFINNYTSQNGFKTIKGAMNYIHQTDARKYVWSKVTELGQSFMLHEPLREVFYDIGIRKEDDIWKIGKPSVVAVL